MTIGIGITTRNRPEILKVVLEHLDKFWPEDETKVIVVEDSSTRKYKLSEFPDSLHLRPIIWSAFTNRLGIAKAKNKCLKYLQDCDHIFLFDDDIFPIKQGWEKLFTESGHDHLMYLTPVGAIQPIRDVTTFRRENNREVNLTQYSNCMGVMLYVSKKTVETVGGFDERFGIYGFEHANYSNRIQMASLSDGYFSPTNVREFLFSLDFEVNNNGQPLPEGIERFNPSLEGEEALVQKYINDNAQVYGMPVAQHVEL